MARHWKPTAVDLCILDDGDPVNLTKAGQESPDVSVAPQSTDFMGSDAIRQNYPSPQVHEAGIQERAVREAKYLEALLEEWVQGDPNHTAALLLLGVTLLAVAHWHWIGWLFAPTWEKFCGVVAVSCLATALYPWLSPLQSRLHAHKTTVKEKMQVSIPLCTLAWIIRMPSHHNAFTGVYQFNIA